MFLSNTEKIKGEKIAAENIKNVVKKVLVGPKEGWSDYVMREFEIAMGGNTPKHSHMWPHINYILEGCGTLLTGEKEYEIKKGGVAYIEPGTVHQFKADRHKNLLFICIVPKEGDK